MRRSIMFRRERRDGGRGSCRRPIRVCERIDVRWLLEDMFAKLTAFAASADGGNATRRAADVRHSQQLEAAATGVDL